MTAVEIVLLVILIVSACAFWLLGVMQLLQRGPLLNNLYPADQENKPDPKPYFRQSGIVFLMAGAMMLVNACAILFHNSRLTLLNALIIPAIVLYVIISTAAMREK